MAEITIPNQDKLINPNWSPPFRDVQINRSEFSKTSRSFGMTANGFWSLSCDVENIVRESEKRLWRLFWQQAADQTNFFRVRLRKCQVPKMYNYTGTAVAVGTGAGSNTIGMNGLPPAPVGNLLRILQAGQYITIQLTTGRFMVATTNIHMDSNPAGFGTAGFLPPLPFAAQNGVPIEIDNPFVMMRLTNPQSGFSESGGVMRIRLEAEEYV